MTKKHGDYTLQKLETMFPKMYHIDTAEEAAGGNSLEEQIKAAVVTFE